MDSEVMRDGRLMDIVDQKWREEKLPLREQEQKWPDLALTSLLDQPTTTTSNSS
jgi:hypothetical protein